MTATYPKTVPLLSLKDGDSLREATLLKLQRFIETQPPLFVGQDAFIHRITEGILDILEEAADLNAQGLELPSLEHERASHEAKMAELAQKEKEAEDHKRHQQEEDEAKALGDLLQQELKRQREKAKESKKKNKGNHLSPARPEDGQDSTGDRFVFDQPCRYKDKAGNDVFFNVVTNRSDFRRGPLSVVYVVRPILPAGHDCASLALKQAELRSAAKDSAVFKKQLQSLESQLESLKKMRHRNMLEVLDYRVDRTVTESEPSNVTVWTLSVLSPIAEKGSLEELLELAGHLDINKVKSWTTDLLDALAYLHNLGLLHQDLHLGNVLLAREPGGDIVPKLADAAFQRSIHNISTKVEPSSASRSARSAYWVPPEIAGVSKPQLTQKTDVWDFGIVVLQMIFGRDVVQKYQSPAKLMDCLSLSGPFYELASKFFKPDPKKRPRAFELSSSEFLATDAPVVVEESSSVLASQYSLNSMAQPAPRLRHDSSIQGPSFSRYREDFVEEGRLGKGGFGEVVKARKKLDGQIYAIKKITQRSQASLTEILKEVRLLSQLSHPAVVRYYNTWLEEIPDTSDTEGETSTEDPTTEESRDTATNEQDIRFATSTGGLDFISSSGYPQVEFEYEGFDSEDEDDADGNDDEDSSSENGLFKPYEENDAGNQVALPDRRKARNHRPFRTVMYISMEYCEKRVCPRHLLPTLRQALLTNE